MNNAITSATPVQVAPVSTLEYLELQKHSVFANISIEQKRSVLSYALGLTLARMMPLPVTPVDSPSAYFISNVEQQVAAIAGNFNEHLVIDYDIVRDFVQKLWSMRYFAAHNTIAIPSFYPFGFFEIVCGAGNYIDEKTHQFVDEFKVPVIDLSNAILRLFNAKTTEEKVVENAKV